MNSLLSVGKPGVFIAVFSFAMLSTPELSAFDGANDACVKCHTKTSPGIVLQWRQSTHSTSEVGCLACHGAKQSEVGS